MNASNWPPCCLNCSAVAVSSAPWLPAQPCPDLRTASGVPLPYLTFYANSYETIHAGQARSTGEPPGGARRTVDAPGRHVEYGQLPQDDARACRTGPAGGPVPPLPGSEIGRAH